jgi:hypothetical protein
MYAFCETCRALTDLLVAVTDKYIVATAHLTGLAGALQHTAFEAAAVKVGMLREEYERIKAEINSHKAERHSSATQI